MVEQVLAGNGKLKEKMDQMDDFFDAQSTIKRLPFGTKDDDASTIREDNRCDTIQSVQTSALKFAFEKILETTWVYKRNERNDCDVSFISSARRSHAWSIFSGVSLADISIKSVIAMPITTLDISNSGHYQRDGESLRFINSLGFDEDTLARQESRDITSDPEQGNERFMQETLFKDQSTSLTDPSNSDYFDSPTQEDFLCRGCGEVSALGAWRLKFALDTY